VFSIVCVLSLALLRKVLDVHRGVVTHTQMHTHALSLALAFTLSLSLARARSPPLSRCLAPSLPPSLQTVACHM